MTLLFLSGALIGCWSVLVVVHAMRCRYQRHIDEARLSERTREQLDVLVRAPQQPVRGMYRAK